MTTTPTSSSPLSSSTLLLSRTNSFHWPDEDEDLPSNVNSYEQLKTLPPECLNNDGTNKADYDRRPLKHMDDRGNVFTYSLNPMMYSVFLILIVELLERFSFYGVYYTQTLYLTGVYDPDWNAGLTSVDASSFVAFSTAVAYTTPFIGAICADALWGDYLSILIGSTCLYLPGVLLVALTTVPHLLGEEFNMGALSASVLVLWPLGTGIVKSVVNVFGAKQFHPLLQSSMIEQYYVNFYMSINIGALAGITLVPIMAQYNVTQAYMLPVGLLVLGILLFVSGTPRYVISKPRGDMWSSLIRSKKTKNISQQAQIYQSPAASNGGDGTQIPNIPLSTIFRITLLIVPFCVGYSQMPTTFIVQGTVMHKAFGFVDAATMNGLDAVSVLVFGYITGNILYPALAERNIKVPTTYKFAIGSFLGALAMMWALLVEYWIHRAATVSESGMPEQVSVLWQAPSYILIGWGEIFAVSAAYEVAFTASSPETKALASAVNIFCVGGIPNLICIFLVQLCHGWFRNSRGDTDLHLLEDYATAHVYKYFFVLLIILLIGMAVNLSDPVRRFVESTEQTAAELVKTPVLMKRMRSPKVSGDSVYADEESPLLNPKGLAAAMKKQKEYEEYLKYGKGPILTKMGSMRAGPSSYNSKKQKVLKKSVIHKLYKSTAAGTGTGSAVLVPPKVSRTILQNKTDSDI